jgi:patatin-like phospholipase/acyl hydrolase
MADPVRILSIDGGGIRGIIPATVLAELELRTGRRIAEMFDLIAGTSTGGILALALTRPGHGGTPIYTAEELIGLYVEEGPEIFSRSIWHRVHSAEGLLDEKYPSGGLERAFHRYLGDARLSDSLTGVLVTAYEIEQRHTFFFKSSKARADAADDYAMRDAAQATSAAPTYFQPVRIDRGPDRPYLALVDGGVFANNPAMCAYAEAVKGRPDADVLLVSLGVGWSGPTRRTGGSSSGPVRSSTWCSTGSATPPTITSGSSWGPTATSGSRPRWTTPATTWTTPAMTTCSG